MDLEVNQNILVKSKACFVRRLDDTIHLMHPYPAGSVVRFVVTFSPDMFVTLSQFFFPFFQTSK